MDGRRGVHFAVWAPNAEQRLGDWRSQRLESALSSHAAAAGSRECGKPSFPISEPGRCTSTTSHLASDGYQVDKADPYGFAAEVRPHTASRVWDLAPISWEDDEWMASRAQKNSLDCADFDLRSAPGGPGGAYPKRATAGLLIGNWPRKLRDYVHEAGYTHVEFLPVTEHPFDGSWGYQTIGYFAPTSRFGTPADFMFLVDYLHQSGIGVILDWVPAHFPNDEPASAISTVRISTSMPIRARAEQPDWNTLRLQLWPPRGAELPDRQRAVLVRQVSRRRTARRRGRFHAVSGLWKERGQWIPNRYGGKENLEAHRFPART